jgi:hypothetical protein
MTDSQPAERVTLSAKSLITLLDAVDALTAIAGEQTDGNERWLLDIETEVARVLAREGIEISVEEVGSDMGDPITETTVVQSEARLWSLVGPDGQVLGAAGLWPDVVESLHSLVDWGTTVDAFRIRSVTGEAPVVYAPILNDDGIVGFGIEEAQ